MRSINEALRPLQPFVGMFIMTTTWMLFSVNNICEIEPRMLFLLFGTIFSNICVSASRKINNQNLYRLKQWFYSSPSQCRLIVAQMSDTRTDGWSDMLWLLLGATVLSLPWNLIGLPIISRSFELAIVYALTVVCTAVHVHYSQGVVSGFKVCLHCSCENCLIDIPAEL